MKYRSLSGPIDDWIGLVYFVIGSFFDMEI